MANQFKLALLDLDGTLWRGGEVISGAGEFVNRVRKQGMRPVFFTNNAIRTPAEVVDTLKRCEIDASEEEVCTSAQAAADVVRNRVAPGSTVVYVGENGLRTALEAVDLVPMASEGTRIREAWVDQVEAAVVGLNQKVTYMDLGLVSRVAYRLGWFVLTNSDVRLPVQDGFLPGNGSLGALVQTASGVSPIVTGKPASTFVDFALKRYGVSKEETVIIGDNIHTDIAAGNQSGVHSILVRTGVTYPVQPGDPVADEIYDSVENIFRH